MRGLSLPAPFSSAIQNDGISIGGWPAAGQSSGSFLPTLWIAHVGASEMFSSTM